MKDIHYFLDAEDKYNNTEPKDNIVCDEDIHEWNCNRDSLDFLRSNPFHRSYGNIDYYRELTRGYNLTDAELTVLGMFFMHCSAPFRDDYYGNKIPELASSMFDVLNSLVSKATITEHTTLYRFCQAEDKHDMKIGDILFIPHNLTCTSDKWNRTDRNIYIIQTLAHDETHAHDIYKMYPHNKNEHQVNFLRGTKFLVTEIKEISGTEFYEFYLEELK